MTENLNTKPNTPLYCKGYNLLELMVGLVIASISTLVVMQVLMVYEGQKRAAVSGDDALNTGAIALYSLQRDITLSGYGLSAWSVLGCNLQLPSGVTLTSMAPVTINHASIPAGDANTDTLLMVFGNGQGGPEGIKISNQTSAQDLVLLSTIGYLVNDQVIPAPQTRVFPCTLNIHTIADVDSSIKTVSLDSATAGMADGRLFNLGQNPGITVVVYAIRNGNLTVCDYVANDCGSEGNKNNPAIWLPVASNIVGLRAQYGRDTSVPMDLAVDVYDQTTPATPSSDQFPCLWVRIGIIRLVVVSRNSMPAGKPCDPLHPSVEPVCATTSVPTWAGSANASVNLSSSTTPAGFNWQDFRYKVLETTVPIRNILISGVLTKCLAAPSP